MGRQNDNKIIESLRTITNADNAWSKLGKVIDTDETLGTCTVETLDSAVQYTNVRISAGQDFNSIRIPAIDSIVIISFLNSDNAYVSLIDEAGKYKITVVDEEGETASLRDILERQNQVIRSYVDEISTAINAATFKHPYGPTIAEPINKVQFDQAKDNADTELDAIDDEIDRLFLPDED